MKGAACRSVRRLPRAGATLEEETSDAVAVEEPLELRVSGETLAVTMRTPGDDPRLALGFLFAEGLIASADDVGAVARCGRPGDEGYGNIVEVTPAAGALIDVDKLQLARRGTLTTSACGVCGRRSIDDLLRGVSPLPMTPRLELKVLAEAPAKLDPLQVTFARTGGVHAAAALDERGELLAAFEDVGRHNAVDKVVGALLQRGQLGPTAAILVVSGRASFELVQKATRARIRALVSVSAASSLAVDLATRAGITLAAFARGGKLNVYSGAERLR